MYISFSLQKMPKAGESINYTFHPKYEEAVKTVVAKGLTESGNRPRENVTEYMAVDYIQSLNSYKVEGNHSARAGRKL